MVSICFATRNRKEEIVRAIESSLAQSHRPLEVIVVDDASDDGTQELIRKLFPEVRCIRESARVGVAGARNRAIREARGSIVLSPDDDSYFTDAGTVTAVLRDFESSPNAAVVAMPFVEPLRPQLGRGTHALDSSQSSPLRAFIGCAHAIRRDAFIAAGGYRELPGYRNEDRDLSIRLLDSGYSIVYGSSPPMVHLFSPNRNVHERYAVDLQSGVLFDYLNIPHPYLFPRMMIDCLQLLLYKLAASQFFPRLKHILHSLGACVKYAGQRRQVSRATYRLYRRLPYHRPIACSGEVPRPASNSPHSE